MLISVYILTYNRSVYLKDSINSVLNQSFKDFKLIVLDNHSSDDTSSVVLDFNDERIHYICHKENIGGINNLNYAIQHCDTEYMVLFHDDDIMLPNFLECEVNIFLSNKDLAAVGANSICFSNDNCVETLFHRTSVAIYSKDEVLKQYLTDRKTICFPSIMYKTSFLRNNHLLLDNDVGPCCDVVFYSDIALSGGKIYEISEPIMKTRIHGEQDSSINFLSMHLQLFRYFYTSSKYHELLLHLVAERKKAYISFCKTLLKYTALLDLDKNNTLSYASRLSDYLMVKHKKNIWTSLINIYFFSSKFFRPIVIKAVDIINKRRVI